MPVLPDLIDQPTLAAYLSDLDLTASQLGLLPKLAASASQAIRNWCRQDFTLSSYDEVYTVEVPTNQLVLRHYPVTLIDRVSTNPTTVLSVSCTDPASQRATVQLATTGDTVTGLVVTGLNLTRWASGVKTTTTIPFASNLTVGAVANAINALSPLWSATVETGYSLWSSADLRATQGASPAMYPAAANFYQHVDDLEVDADNNAGILQLGQPANSTTTADSARFGPPFTGSINDAQNFGGTNGVRVIYTAGYATVPADVETYTAETVQAWLMRLRNDPTLKSESDGVISYSFRDTMLVIPREVMLALSKYCNTRG